MSYEYQTAISPVTSNLVFSCVGAILPVNNNLVYSGVGTIPPVINNSVYSCVGMIPPVISNSIYSCVGAISPVISNSIYSCVGTIPPVISNSIYSCVGTVPPVISNSIYSCVAPVSPVTSNSVYTPVGTASPVTFTPVNSVEATSTPNSEITTKRKLDDSLKDESFEGKRSRISIDNSGYSQSSSNDSLNVSSDVDKFSLVGYNSSPTTKPCGRDNKAGWYDIHNKHVSFANRSRAVVILFGDSIIDGLSRYNRVWSRHFKPLNALNCGIGGDRTQHVLWRAEKMVLPDTVQFAVIHCGTNNVDRDSPQDIANGVISCGLALQEKKPDLKIILTGLLPRDLEPSMRRSNIIQTNKYIKKFCRKFDNFTYMKEDSDWTLDSGLLNEYLYYTDHLHLVECGNEKFSKSIINTLTKLSKNEEITYSSDESEDNDSFNFVRKIGESRKKENNNDSFNKYNRRNFNFWQYDRNRSYDNENPYRFERKNHNESRHNESRHNESRHNESRNNESRHNESRHKRKRSASPDKPVKPVNHKCKPEEDSNSDGVVTPKKPRANRKLDSVKTEFHGEFALSKELREEKLRDNLLFIQTTPEKTKNEPLEGVAKSIDINLGDNQRLEARKAKFGNPLGGANSSLKRLSDISKAEMRSKPVATSAPSALVLKIKRSMEQAREELSKKKLMVSVQGHQSPGESSQGESTPPNKKMKPILPEYGSGSDSD